MQNNIKNIKKNFDESFGMNFNFISDVFIILSSKSNF